ncbi:unnamed protein product [Moneuplotes crassus]|uniref:C2HC/C3H-type domain-containing protein n=1 Tax=Euplotes crassus TaxID=5936 RepID=A0AAD1Y4I6_EUPCR|nr:unnamed protein product [Moneuplotes crassus]
MRANDSSAAAEALGFGRTRKPEPVQRDTTSYGSTNYGYTSSYLGESQISRPSVINNETKRISSHKIIDYGKTPNAGYQSAIKESYIPSSTHKIEDDFSSLKYNHTVSTNYQGIQGSYNQPQTHSYGMSSKLGEGSLASSYNPYRPIENNKESMSSYHPPNFPYLSKNYEAGATQKFQETSQPYYNINPSDQGYPSCQNEITNHFKDPNGAATNFEIPADNDSYLRTPPKEKSPPRAWGAGEQPRTAVPQDTYDSSVILKNKQNDSAKKAELSPEEIPIPHLKQANEKPQKSERRKTKKEPRTSLRTDRPKKKGGLIKNPNILIFKELEKHALEDEILDADERSPSPTARPDHPTSKANFFKKERSIPGIKRKPKTLASVLEKKSKELASGKTKRCPNKDNAKAMATRKNSSPKGRENSKIATIKKASYYTQSIYNQSKEKRERSNNIQTLIKSRIPSAKTIRPQPEAKFNQKGVKRAKFDLTTMSSPKNRTMTPKKTISKFSVQTPTSKMMHKKTRLRNSKLVKDSPRSGQTFTQRKTTLTTNSAVKAKSRVPTSTVKLHKTPKKKQVAKKKFISKNEDPNDGREQCRSCQRWFLPERVEKHESACYKINNTKRAKFNSTRQREIDSDQRYFKNLNVDKYEEKKQAKKSNWKKKSSQFREAMKAAREGKVAPAQDDQTLVPCKYCNRTFKEETAERHIPFCAKKAKQNKIKKGIKKRK